MVEATLTPEQRVFAEDNHDLVYAFLNDNNLPDDDYYDIVVFGFLRAVKRHFEEWELYDKYSFTTLAWNAMRSSLYERYREQARPKRKAIIIDLDYSGRDETQNLTLRDTLCAREDKMLDLEMELLLLELASKVSKRDMSVIRMRMDGYNDREIARAHHITLKSLTELLASLRDTARAVCDS